MLRTRAESGLNTPALEAMPDLNEYLSGFLSAFLTLNRARTTGGMSANPLLMTDIEAYCRLKGIDNPEEREEFLSYMQTMDDEFLAFQQRKGQDSAKK